MCVQQICFLLRFLRIHSVQSVINNPAQLSGRGFPNIFYMNLVLSQMSFPIYFIYNRFYVLWCSQMDAGQKTNRNCQMSTPKNNLLHMDA